MHEQVNTQTGRSNCRRRHSSKQTNINAFFSFHFSQLFHRRKRTFWNKFVNAKPRVNVVRMSGMIQDAAGRSNISAKRCIPLLKLAFDQKAIAPIKAVCLEINSGGGSPVQSDILLNYIVQRSKATGIPVYAFVEDVAASGGYYLACSATQIFANRNSLIGSIGVISASVGVDKLIQRLDIEPRIKTAGKRKLAFGNPLLPETPESIALITKMLQNMHEEFIDVVKASRGDKLSAAGNVDLFEGDVWTAKDALKLGLIDGIGDLHSVIDSKFSGEEYKLNRIKMPFSWSDAFQGFGATMSIMGEHYSQASPLTLESDQSLKHFSSMLLYNDFVKRQS